MKNLFLKSLALILMLTMSVSIWGATQFCETPSGHNGSTEEAINSRVKLTIEKSSEAGFVDVTVAMNRDQSATSKIDYVYVLYNGLPYTAGTDDNGDALDELTAHVNVGGAASGNLMIQYSNPNWAGRWQINLTDVDFTATCSSGPVAPVASTWEAGDVDAAKGVATYISAKWSGDKANAVDDIVNDDNIQLQVTAAQPTEWLVIDLGANYDVEKFSLTTRGDRKDKKFAICTASAQASAPEFADGTDALAGVWKEEYIFDDDYTNTGRTTLTYSVSWKDVRYIKYQATERNANDQYGTSICEFRVKGTSTDESLTIPHHINITSVPELYVGQSGNIVLTVCNSSNGTLSIDPAQLTATSSADGVATVARDGEQIRVNAISAGTATITINYGSLSKIQEITIRAAMTAPAAPTHAEEDVLSLWSDSYPAYDYSWQDWGGCTLSSMTIDGNKIERAKGFKYLGSQFKSPTDVSSYDYLHVDLYPTAATTIGIVPITSKAEGGNNPERGVTTAELPANEWSSLDIALSNFTDNGVVDFNRLYQIKYIKQVTPATDADGSFDLFLDNVYFWKAASDAPKQVSATVNDPAMGTVVVKQDGVEVTEAAIGSNVDFIAEANDGYLFLGWYKGSELQSTNATYTVENIQANTTLQARFRALNNIYCHTELKTGDEAHTIYLTMKKTSENDYQIVIDTEEETTGFGGSYLGGYSETGDHQIQLNTTANMAKFVTISDNKHRITINVTSTTPLRWNTPIYMRYDGYPGDYAFAAPQGKTIEYDVTCAPVAVETVTLNQTEATVDVESTVTLTASASPIYADNQTVTWTSNNETVATVVNGVVTGHVEGNATITATIDGQTATCAITVALDPTVPHVAAPAVDATGKEIRAIYSDDVELAITNANFGLNVYGNSPYEKKAIEGNSFLLYTATEDKQVISWGSTNGAENALLGKAGMTNPDNAGDKGLYAADMKYLHIDIWSSATATNFQIQNDNTILCMVNLDGTGWQSFDIDMTGKENNLKNISIIKFTNTPRNTKVALDNLYFWKSNGTAAVTGVSLNKTTASIEVGEQTTLLATIAPEAAANKNVTWSTSAEGVATVVDGVVTGVAAGEATITVRTEDGGFEASCVVTVNAIQAKTWWGTASNANMSIVYSVTRNENKTLTYSVEMSGTYGAERQINDGKEGEWHVLTNNDGVWSWTSTLTYNTGENVHAFWYFPERFDFDYVVGSENERPVVDVTGMNISETAITLMPTETKLLTANVLPANATDKSFTWATDNAEVATVVDGLVTAVAAGTANITATSANGKTATCVVTVATELTATTVNGNGENNGVAIRYFITRNTNRTLTYNVYAQTNHTGLGVQVNDGAYHNATLVNGAYTWTSETVYADGAIVTGFFYMPYTGNAARVDYTYTVGSGSTAPLAQINEAAEDASALNALNNQTTDLAINRSIADNGFWNTLCLPFNMTAAQIAATFGADAEVRTLTSARMESEVAMTINYSLVSEIQAGRPYIIRTSQAIPALFFQNITVDADASTECVADGGLVKMVGTFTKSTIPAGDEYFYLSASEGVLYCYGEALAIKAFRCYYVFQGEAAARAQHIRARIVMSENTATELEDENSDQNTVKILRDGQIIIIRNNHEYNTQGLLIK